MLPIPQHAAAHAGAGSAPDGASCYLPLLTADPAHPLPGQLNFAQGGAAYVLPLHGMAAHHALHYGAQGGGGCARALLLRARVPPGLPREAALQLSGPSRHAGVLPAAPGLLAGGSMEGPLPSIVIGRLPSGVRLPLFKGQE